jgi:hypothetical protein
MRIKFEGKSYTFPDDFSEEEITSALQSEQPSSPETPAPTDAAGPTGFPEPPPGMLSRAASAVGEMITGNERATPETQSLPDWMQMPSLGLSGGWNAFKTVAGSTFAAPDEIAQMVQSNIPGAGVRQDAKGNYIFKDPQDGQEYAMAPGFTASDLGRVATALPLMAMPIGKGIAQAVGIGAATQAGIEGSQALAGGSFDPAQVALAGATMGAFKGAGNVVGALKAAKNPISVADVVGDTASKGISMVEPAPLMGGEDLAKLARKAGDGGFGSSKATEELAQQARPNAQLAEDAALLKAEISPEYLAASTSYKQIAEALKSAPASLSKNNKINSSASLAEAADNTLKEVGAVGNYGGKNAAVKGAVRKNISDLKAAEDVAYKEIASLVPANTPIKTNKTLEFLNKKLADGNGDIGVLSALEKDVYQRLTPKATTPTEGLTVRPFKTFALFDTTRKLVGKANKNPIYADADEGIAKNLYSLMMDDYKAALEPLGHVAKLEAANATTVLRKGFEKESQSLFGKKLATNMFAQVKKATKGLATGADEDYVNVMKAIPEEYRKDAAVDGLRLMFGKASKDGMLNTSNFHTFWEATKANPRSFTALASNLPSGLVKKLDGIARLSKSIATPVRGESAEVVRQRLVGANTITEKLGEAASNFSARAGAETITRALNWSTFGAVWTLQKLLTRKPGAAFEALDKLLASPEFLATARKLATPDEKLALKKFTMSKSFKAFKVALKNPKDLDRMEETLINAVQAASRPEREKL